MSDFPPIHSDGHPFNKFPDEGSDPRAEFQEQLSREIAEQFTAFLLLNMAIAEKMGIAMSDMQAMRIAWELGGCSIGTIGERLHLTSGAVTKMVDRLVAEGFVERLPDPTDRRRTIVQAIPDRVNAVGLAFDPLGAKVMSFIDGLEPEQVATIRRWVAFSTEAALEASESLRSRED
jgi:DNA-binding MarR family transcriptional regulator